MRRASATLALVAALAGCGGERARAPGGDGSPGPTASGGTGTTAPALDPRLVAALGDSITAGSPLWDPDPGFRARIAAPTGMAPDETSQWGYWYEREHPGVSVRNCGVFGERTDEIAARLEACAAGAATLVVQGGINDIAQGRAVADAARELEAMVARGRAAGREVALVEVLPWNNGYPDAAPRIRELNGLIRAIGRRRRVPVFGWFAALEDPSARDRMRARLTIDGDHPSIAGYERLAGLVRLRAGDG